MDFTEQSLGQLARSIPGATRIFAAHRFDFCCAGNQTLRAAAAAAGIDADVVVRELQELAARETPTSEPNWSEVDDRGLIDHVLKRYHEVHREQLPELIRLARRVEQVHAGRGDCPHGLADHLSALAQVLDSHMRKEETILFPALVNRQDGVAGAPIALMRGEHDEHGVALRRLEELTQDITLPPDACNTWTALYTGLRSFRDDLMDHIHLENNILFERHAPAAVH